MTDDVDPDLFQVAEVQAPTITEGQPHSDSELARIVAHHSNWGVTRNGHLIDGAGGVIAGTLTAAGEAMATLGWLFHKSNGLTRINWHLLPVDPDKRAEELRQLGGQQKRHQTAAIPSDPAAWVREARRIADTTTPDVRAQALRDAVYAFYDSRKLTSSAMCLVVDEQELLGAVLNAAIRLAEEVAVGWRQQMTGQ